MQRNMQAASGVGYLIGYIGSHVMDFFGGAHDVFVAPVKKVQGEPPLETEAERALSGLGFVATVLAPVAVWALVSIHHSQVAPTQSDDH